MKTYAEYLIDAFMKYAPSLESTKVGDTTCMDVAYADKKVIYTYDIRDGHTPQSHLKP